MDNSSKDWIHIDSLVFGRKLLIDMNCDKVYIGNLITISPNMQYIRLGNVTEVFEQKNYPQEYCVSFNTREIRTVMLINGVLKPALSSKSLLKILENFTNYRTSSRNNKTAKKNIYKNSVQMKEMDEMKDKYECYLKNSVLYPDQWDFLIQSLINIQHIYNINGNINFSRYICALNDINKSKVIFIDIELKKYEPQFLSVFLPEKKQVYIFDKCIIKLDGVKNFLINDLPTKILHDAKKIKTYLHKFYQINLTEPITTAYFLMPYNKNYKNQDDRPVKSLLSMVNNFLKIPKDFFGNKMNKWGTSPAINWRNMRTKEKQLTAKKVILTYFLYIRMLQEGLFNIYFRIPSIVKTYTIPQENERNVEVIVDYVNLDKRESDNAEYATVEHRLNFTVPDHEWQETSEP